MFCLENLNPLQPFKLVCPFFNMYAVWPIDHSTNINSFFHVLFHFSPREIFSPFFHNTIHYRSFNVFILWSDHSNIHSIYKLLYKEHCCSLLIHRCWHTTGLFTFSDSFFNDSWLKHSIGTIYIAHTFSQFTRRIL